MLNRALRQSLEYKRLLAGIEGSCTAIALFGLPPAARSEIMAALCQDTKRKAIVVTQSEAEAVKFSEDAAAFGSKAEVYPSRDYVLRAVDGQNHEYEYRRLEAMGNIVGGRTDIICCGIEAVLQLTMPKAEFLQNTLTVKPGAKISTEELRTRLFEAGYLRRSKVEGPGQFSIRGGLVDIFAPDMQAPARIEFWGDVIDTIHSFDLSTQRRETSLDKIYISPAREVLFGDAKTAAELLNNAISNAAALRKASYEKAFRADIISLESDVVPCSMDKYLRLRYKKPETILDYVENPIIFVSEPSAVRESAKAIEFRTGEEIKALIEEGVLAGDLSELYENAAYFFHRITKNNSILCENFSRTIPDVRLADTINAPAHSVPPWSGEVSALIDDLQPLLEQKYSITIMCGTRRASESLAKDLTAAGISAAAVKQNSEPTQGLVCVTSGHLSSGAEYQFAKYAVLTGRRHTDSTVKKPKAKAKGLSSLEDVKPGDYVVHQNHGIGVFMGIERIDLHGIVKDYLKILYDKGDTLYVPVTQLDVVSRYTAPGDGEKVRLTRLGGTEWVKTKSRVRAATQEMAKELIELYAKRQQAHGHAFPEDGDWQRDFETRFEYDETNDQLQSASEIKHDMEKSHPMDRLLCGDVGVGKTEVALRAAFKCVMGGKQCAVLVPTTILAWQHYNTMLSRMEAFPIKIGMLSRFRTPTQVKATVSGISNGTVDIVVGTHRMLQKDIRFKDLGLVIIDEEQRFGVKDKEKLKSGFIDVDMLTLSATPIPRTLNMAMSGIRDMSTIEEPPFERKPIETYVMEYDDNVIAEALRRELARGGQVYYLHNRVETIDLCTTRVAKMAPGARIGTAHGRMTEAELSRVWQQLLDAEIDILVCTTIIETGVDVRNCNTLIIEDSDRMGLAQLYQIRGRVGRSGRKAYAYFTFRRDKVLTDIAAKRLSAIREFTSFGSGFRIAMRDLQIRGAGNILGGHQHGHMEAVGYDMYVKLLNTAVAEAKGEVVAADKSDCLIDVTLDAYIPEKYIGDASLRIEAYKRIAAIDNREDASDVLDELIDRYGDIPKSVSGLVDISLIRVSAARLGIYEITQQKESLIFYSDNINIDMVKNLLKALGKRTLVNSSGKAYIAVRLLQGETPIDLMNLVFREMENKQ